MGREGYQTPFVVLVLGACPVESVRFQAEGARFGSGVSCFGSRGYGLWFRVSGPKEKNRNKSFQDRPEIVTPLVTVKALLPLSGRLTSQGCDPSPVRPPAYQLLLTRASRLLPSVHAGFAVHICQPWSGKNPGLTEIGGS